METPPKRPQPSEVVGYYLGIALLTLLSLVALACAVVASGAVLGLAWRVMRLVGGW